MAGASFKVFGEEYNLPDDATIGEMCDAEREFGSEGVRLTAGLIWIAIRRRNPKVTVEDIRALPMEEVLGTLSAEGDARPPEQTLEKPNSSGGNSNQSSDSLDEMPEPTGVPG